MLEKKHLAMLQHVESHRHPQVDNIRVCFEVLALASAINRDCATRLGKHRLSEGKFIVLFLLQGQSGGLSPHELAEHAGVSRATITGLLDGLERDGFVSRQAAEGDRRSVKVYLTRKGKTISRTLFAVHSQWITTVFANLSNAEKTVLSQLLKKAWLKTDVASPASAQKAKRLLKEK